MTILHSTITLKNILDGGVRYTHRGRYKLVKTYAFYSSLQLISVKTKIETNKQTDKWTEQTKNKSKQNKQTKQK